MGRLQHVARRDRTGADRCRVGRSRSRDAGTAARPRIPRGSEASVLTAPSALPPREHPVPPWLRQHVARVASAARYPLPSYLPDIVRETRMAHWAQRHVGTVAARYHLGIDDLWDEAVTAPIRAAAYHKPELGPSGPYAATAVHRACWRYVVRGHQIRPTMVPLEETALPFTVPSAEAEAPGREAARRAWILRQHAALANTRGDHDTATRLRDAATTATRTACRPPRATSAAGA